MHKADHAQRAEHIQVIGKKHQTNGAPVGQSEFIDMANLPPR
jgi:hypothetical protein